MSTPQPVPVDKPGATYALLHTSDALLLDFDGPVRGVFAGFPADVVAGQLRETLAQGGYVELPPSVAESDDPFDVLEYAATLGENEAVLVEAALRAYEVEAVLTALPTYRSAEVIGEWKKAGRKIAIMSNNSAAAVHAYLDLHGLSGSVDVVSARESSDPALLKPHPHLVEQALDELKVSPRRAVLVGDSDSDIVAAKGAHSRAIGYANKPGKVSILSGKKPECVVTSMALLLEYTRLFRDAVQHTLQWASTAGQLARRIEENQGLDHMDQHQNDASLLVIALRNLIRAARFACSFAPNPTAADKIQAAIGVFEDATPNARELRDIIEHFDDYNARVGNMQRAVCCLVDLLLVPRTSNARPESTYLV